MRLILLLLLSCCAAVASNAQALKKYNIGKSGCAAYLACNPGTFELAHSPDSSKVFTGECKAGDVTYDIICVQMKEQIKLITDAEAVLEQYLDYLKSSFQISTAVGYGKGHKLKGNENTRGITDTWKDKEGNNIKIKGWTNGKYIAVFIMISEKEIPDAKAKPFLDGIVFPAIVAKPVPKGKASK